MAVMRPSHAGAQLIDDFGNRIEAVNFRVGSKKLPTRMFAALYADVDDNKRLGQQALGHHPLGERRIGVMIEVHMPAVLQGFRLGAAVCVWRRRAGKLASNATAAVVRKARGSRWRVRERAGRVWPNPADPAAKAWRLLLEDPTDSYVIATTWCRRRNSPATSDRINLRAG